MGQPIAADFSGRTIGFLAGVIPGFAFAGGCVSYAVAVFLGWVTGRDIDAVAVGTHATFLVGVGGVAFAAVYVTLA